MDEKIKKRNKECELEKTEGKFWCEVCQREQEGPCSFCKIQQLLNGEKDALCGVWNREKGKLMLEERLKDRDHSYLIVLLDTDNLKKINEEYGYGEGDFLLKQTAEVLKEFIKEPDFVFRLSGDEFVVVLRDVKEEEGTRQILSWRNVLEEKGKIFQKPYGMSFSYGTSYAAVSGTFQANELITQADEKMYAEKLRRRKNSAVKTNPFKADAKSAQKIEYPSEFLYEALVNSTDDFIYVCDVKTGLFRYSPAQVEMFELPGEIVENPLVYWKNIVHPEDWERFYKSNMEIGEDKADYHSVEFRARKRSGEYSWIRCKGQLIRDEYGKPSFFAGIMKLLGQQNKIDPLTQLLNHAEFMKALEKNIHEEMVEKMAVILLDVDDFHQINELYNRSLGDEVLKILGQAIQSILPDNATLYRLEKDCMGIIMEHGDEEQVEALYRNIQNHIMKMHEWKQRKLNIEMSAGCSMYPKDGKTSEGLYRCAAFTLQQAKQQGKNQILFFSEDIMKSKSRFIQLIRQLREDISRNYRGFYLNYQPQVDAKTKQIIGVEALMRWKDSQGNLVSPGEFIPIMEENAMIYNAGLWMVRTALRDCKEWIKIQPGFSVSVNISALQLLEEHFLEDFYKVVEEEHFPWENLIMELTESYTVKNMNVFWDKFSQLREKGIRIAMDDFGTGYSSLEVLKNAPVDIVKIDRAFVKDILNSRFDATFISFVVAICHEVNIIVYQEGVETEEEYDFLQGMDLDCIQGYYFGMPMSKQKITEMIKRG